MSKSQDATNRQFREIYLRMVELYVDYGTDGAGEVVPGNLVPVPAEYLNQMMAGFGDALSRLAAVDIMVRVFQHLTPASDTLASQGFQQVIDVLELPEVTSELLDGLLKWQKRFLPTVE